jgi:hypothetical protein
MEQQYGNSRQGRPQVAGRALGWSVADSRAACTAQADNAVCTAAGQDAQATSEPVTVGNEQPCVRKLNYVRAMMHFPPDVDPADTDWEPTEEQSKS